jgi:DNA ligase 1
VRYLIVAEAYRDLEQLSSRLALTERLAVLLADTPANLLPTVCYTCQGLIAPELAGIDLGVAEKLAVRAVAGAPSPPRRPGLAAPGTRQPYLTPRRHGPSQS